mmetsp:Transcript_6108/g.6839  ORF Transcript_6108/g.6839 Transcript_6108/m.6839 type:complete len:249 (+) Transcript_6108:1442-2188(+)
MESKMKMMMTRVTIVATSRTMAAVTEVTNQMTVAKMVVLMEAKMVALTEAIRVMMEAEMIALTEAISRTIKLRAIQAVAIIKTANKMGLDGLKIHKVVPTVLAETKVLVTAVAAMVLAVEIRVPATAVAAMIVLLVIRVPVMATNLMMVVAAETIVQMMVVAAETIVPVMATNPMMVVVAETIILVMETKMAATKEVIHSEETITRNLTSISKMDRFIMQYYSPRSLMPRKKLFWTALQLPYRTLELF